MKPAYWIAIIAVVGAVVGYALARSGGWLGVRFGTVIGILSGPLLYACSRKPK